MVLPLGDPRRGPRPRGAGEQAAPRPFLKWAGGKRQLLPELRRFYPSQFGRYFEPFVGSGAVFFDLAAKGRLDGRHVVLSDVNADVIGCYAALRSDYRAVVRHLERLGEQHARLGDTHYYVVRDGLFNPMRRRALARRRRRGGLPAYSPRLAAMAIYLNRTGFNGLFRLNRSGQFNVPAGRHVNPRICDAPTLGAAARVLSARDVHLGVMSFEQVLESAAAGDFLYFDPPYAPLTATSHFTSYTETGFGDEDQRRLQQVVVALARRGCQVLLSNSTAGLIHDLYEHSDAARRAGLRAWKVRARRAINARASARGPIDELLITNIPRDADSRTPGRQAG
jgi:DNA adenine methylase